MGEDGTVHRRIDCGGYLVREMTLGSAGKQLLMLCEHEFRQNLRRGGDYKTHWRVLDLETTTHRRLIVEDDDCSVAWSL